MLSRAVSERGIYPAVDPLDSTSRMLDPRIVGDVSLSITRSFIFEFWFIFAFRHQSGALQHCAFDSKNFARFQIVARYHCHSWYGRIVQRRSSKNKKNNCFFTKKLKSFFLLVSKDIVYRARKIQKFLSQPFTVAEVFTGMKGKTVTLEVQTKLKITFIFLTFFVSINRTLLLVSKLFWKANTIRTMKLRFSWLAASTRYFFCF